MSSPTVPGSLRARRASRPTLRPQPAVRPAATDLAEHLGQHSAKTRPNSAEFGWPMHGCNLEHSNKARRQKNNSQKLSECRWADWSKAHRRLHEEFQRYLSLARAQRVRNLRVISPCRPKFGGLCGGRWLSSADFAPMLTAFAHMPPSPAEAAKFGRADPRSALLCVCVCQLRHASVMPRSGCS